MRVGLGVWGVVVVVVAVEEEGWEGVWVLGQEGR